jgi:putative ABC transport system permease protein
MTNLPHVYIINEKSVEALNLNSPVGSKGTSSIGIPGEVIGVVKDFHFASFRSTIEPMVIEYFNAATEQPVSYSYLLVRIEQGHFNEVISHFRKTINQLVPESLFSYEVLEENLENLYRAEKHVLELFKVFALLSIFISCLGLFGMSAYSAELKVKEIGIRKTFGASNKSLFTLFSKDFLKYVILAIVISIPIGWIVMQRWLQNFAFSISINWWMILLTIVLLILIALLTISYQALRAALGDPAKALQYE